MTIDLSSAACIDIHRCDRDGPAAIVGVARHDGVAQFVRGQRLTRDALRSALAGVQLLITYGGNDDVAALSAEFEGVLPPTLVCVDAREFAGGLGDAGAMLDAQFEVGQRELQRPRRQLAIGMWKLYADKGVEDALRELLNDNLENTDTLVRLVKRLAVRA